MRLDDRLPDGFRFDVRKRRTREPAMQDGLYRVLKGTLCAGFVIRDNKVVECAPILRKRIDYWKTQGIRFGW